MATRFDSCQQVGEELTEKALTEVAAQVDSGGAPGVVVFNPGSGPRSDFVTFRWPVKNGEEPRAVIDAKGRESPCQVLSRPEPYYMSMPGLPAQEMEVGFVARDVPGYGYRAFRVATGAPQTARRAPQAAGSIENEFFRVEADLRDGTITLHDKETGRVLKGLNRFVDGGDRGDEYAYWPPARDALVDRPARPPLVRVVENGPARSILEVEMLYRLPRSLDGSRRDAGETDGGLPDQEPRQPLSGGAARRVPRRRWTTSRSTTACARTSPPISRPTSPTPSSISAS